MPVTMLNAQTGNFAVSKRQISLLPRSKSLISRNILIKIGSNLPMKRFRYCFTPLAAAVALALWTAPLNADVVVLKGTGERLEGKVISEDDATILFEYNLTPKIKDTRTINKTDIRELTRLSPSQLAYQEQKLDQILPTQDLLRAADYEAIIQDQLRTFVAKFPGTPEAAKAEEIIATLSEEKAKAVNGELKVEGKWLDEKAVKRDTYGIEAYRARMNMNAEAEKLGDLRYTKALREFEKLQTNYPASLSYVAAIPEALEIMEKYDKQLQGMTLEQPLLAKQREDGIKQLSGPSADLTKRSIQEEVDNFKATIDEQKKSKIIWRDIYKYDAASLKEAQETVAKQTIALKALDTETLSKENQLLTGISRALADEDAIEAANLLGKLPKSTMINKAALSAFEKQLLALQKSLQEKRKKEVSANVTASTTENRNTPGGTTDPDASKNALAEALKKAQGKGEPAAAPETGAPAQGAEGKPAEPTAATPKPAAPKPKPAPTPAATDAATAPVAEEEASGGISDYIPMIGGGLVVVLLLAWLAGKRKKKEDVAE